jgi:hypothetical protein
MRMKDNRIIRKVRQKGRARAFLDGCLGESTLSLDERLQIICRFLLLRVSH